MSKSIKDKTPAFAKMAQAFDPKWSWLLVALGIGTLSVAYPVFAGQFLVNPHSDQYIAGYGFREFAAQSLRDGHGFPQWSPYLFGGLPYIAAMHGDIFYPTFLLRMIMRTDLAMTWGFIIHLFLAGAFTLGFLRALRFAAWPAAFGAFAYMLSGPIASYASPGHDGKLFVSALLPLGLWMLTRAIRDNIAWAWGVFALTVGLAVLSPHPQLLQFFLLLAGSFALFLVWQQGLDSSGASRANAAPGKNIAAPAATMRAPAAPSAFAPSTITGAASTASGPVAPGVTPSATAASDQTAADVRVPFNIRFAVSRLGTALAMVLIGAGIGAIQYWPVLGYVNVSPRANGREYQFASSFSFPPEELLNTFLPQFSGMFDAYWGRNGIHLHSEYLGIVVLMLAPLAFGTGSRRALARFWFGVAILSLLWALGSFTPFFHLIYAVIPGTRYFRAPSTILYVFSFAMALLSTLGFERILNGRLSSRFVWRYAAGWTAFALVLVLLAWSGSLLAVSKTLAYDTAIARGYDPAGYNIFVSANERATRIGSFRSLVAVLATGLVLAAFLKGKLNKPLFALLMVGTLAVDLWSISHRYWKFSDPARILYKRDLVIDYLKAQQQPGRVFVYSKNADFRTATDPFFGSNGFGAGTGFMVHGIRSVTGYQGNVLARYEQLSAGNGLINPAFWQHENVRWLYTNIEIADSVLKHIAGPVVNAAGSTSYLYSMPGENSYAWVAAGAAALPDSAAGAAILNSTYNPRSLALFDPALNIGKAPPDSALVPAPSTIATNIKSFGAGSANIELSAPAGAGNTLVVSENYYPGWHASVEGKDVPVLRVDYNLLGIQLPAGARSVQLSFKDERYETGKLVTLVSLALTALLIAVGFKMRGRSTAVA